MQRYVEHHKIIKEIPGVKNTPNKRSSVTSCGWISDDLTLYHDTHNTSCHASFKNTFAPDSPSYAWNGFTHIKKNKDYLDWIVNANISPWKTVLQDSIIITKQSVIDSILINSQNNGFITCNLFIGARIATEHNRGVNWNMFVKEGIQPNLACIFTNYILVGPDNKMGYRDPSNWHRPFNPDSVDLKKFLSSNPINNPDSSIKDGKYNNICNHIWGVGSLKTDINDFFKNAKEIQIKSRFTNANMEELYPQPVKQIETFDQLREFQTYLLEKYKDKG